MLKLMMMMLALTNASCDAATTKKTITIAVIDTGIDASVGKLCKYGHKDFTNNSIFSNPLLDTVGHGTHIAGLIRSHAGEGDYCLVAIKFYSESASGPENLRNMIRALRYAIDIKVDFINVSGGGPEGIDQEKNLIKEALDKGIKVVAAAGNEKRNLDIICDYFPACYFPDRIVVVGNLEITKDFRMLSSDWKELAVKAGMGHKLNTYETKRASSSSYGSKVNRWEIGTNVLSALPGGKAGYMTGTSQATAIATGKLVKERLSK